MDTVASQLRAAEGKTKIVNRDGDIAVIVSKDDLTAGNGQRHEVLQGKGVLANETTCNVFELLREHGLPLAYINRISGTSFAAWFCRMIQLEVVVRRKAAGSYLKRNPGVPKWGLLAELQVEFYLKTAGRQWNGKPLPCDDPLLLPDEREQHYLLYEPDRPIKEQEPCLALDPDELFASIEDAHLFPEMGDLAKRAFNVLCVAWERLGLDLIDFKVEFGITPHGDLVIADVIDNDSGRLLFEGQHVDKQLFRDGEPLEVVEEAYRFVADRSFYLRSL